MCILNLSDNSPSRSNTAQPLIDSEIRLQMRNFGVVELSRAEQGDLRYPAYRARRTDALARQADAYTAPADGQAGRYPPALAAGPR